MIDYDLVRILVVDDDEDDYLLVCDLFEEIDTIPFDLEWAPTYQKALEVRDHRPPDVYLLDYHLGQQTGMELLHALIAQDAQPPVVIMLTGLASRDIDLEAMKAGATDYLIKSRLDADRLERSIRYALMKKQAEKALRHAHDELEQRVQERTAELVATNELLEQEVAERRRAEAALQAAHDDLEARVQERTVALSISNQLLELEVTQRREWEQVLRRSEAKQRALIDALPDALLKLRRDGQVLDYKMPHNSMAPLLFDGLKGKRLDAVLPPAFAGRVMDHVVLALQTGRLHVFEEHLPAHDEVRDVEARVVVGGEEEEALCILRDISERKRADRLKNEFISVVSHELRTPLTSISGSLALMAAGVTGTLPAQSQAMIEIAHRNSERLVRLINDLLDLQKIESGTMPLHLQPTALLAVLDQAIEANYAYGSRYGVAFVLADDAPDLWVEADTDRLMQVMTNLLSNAAKFSPAGSTVRLALTRRGGTVRVSVADQGPGIPKDYQDRIFQQFVQIDSSMTRQKEGTGLGLSISKSIIEMHGGRIGFESTPGQGTTFYFDLPAWQPALDADDPTADLPAAAPRMLICEDDPDVACVLRGMLAQEGVHADMAHTMAEARRLLSQHDYAAITLDLVLPDENGIALLREWGGRPAGPPLPVIVCSAEAEEARTHLQGGALWVVDWLDKPLDSDRLRGGVKRALAQTTRGKARILHLEDDRSIAVLVRLILDTVADVEHVTCLHEATARLRETRYDLAILDLNLPDGRGIDLLPVLHQQPGEPMPVVIFSSEQVDASAAQQVSQVLLKTAVTNGEFLHAIRMLLPDVLSQP